MSYRHIFLAVLVAILWGFNFVVIKSSLDKVPPFSFAFLRYIVASLPLIYFVKRPPISIGLLISIGLTMGFLKFSFLFIGVSLGINSGLGSLILQSQAFFTILLAGFIFKYRLTTKQISGIAIAFLGIYLIGREMHTQANCISLICIIAASFSWAISNILIKKAGPIDSFALIIWTSLVPLIPFLIMSFLFEGGNDVFIKVYQQFNWKITGCILYISCIATWIGATLWAKLMKIYPPSIIAPYSLLIPIFAFFFGWIFLGERISNYTILSSILVFFGLAMTQWSSPRQHTHFKTES